MNLQLVHTLHDRIELRYKGRQLFEYVYQPTTHPMESPKPYFHPLNTLAGNLVTNFRPYDHLWHHGLAMTMAHLSGQNFWGGGTYVHGQGYVQLENNGRQQHEAWEEIECDDAQALLCHRLTWITYAGESWISEMRRIHVSTIQEEAGFWNLDFGCQLTNIHGEPLVFGSPTTEGRPMAGYGGLFWRGPRSFFRGQILAGNNLEGPEVMGQPAPWLAFIGPHDGTGDLSTLLFLDHPGNLRYPNKWFVRNDPFACVSFAFSFDEEYVLEPDATLALNYRIVIANGVWSREQIEAQAKAWQST